MRRGWWMIRPGGERVFLTGGRDCPYNEERQCLIDETGHEWLYPFAGRAIEWRGGEQIGES